jgi:predicted GIY-YIG superfamily endonuclease
VGRPPIKPIVGETDLATTQPELAAQLVDPSKAVEVVERSSRLLDWRCGEGHVWDMAVRDRAIRGRGCPYCGRGRTKAGVNDVATTHPHLVDYFVDKDEALTVTASSHRKVRAQCELGHQWNATVRGLAEGRRCPYCANWKVMAGFNDLATTHPEVAARLVDQSLVQTIIAGTDRKFDWRCDAGHIYQAPPSRLISGARCGYCTGRFAIPGETDLATTHPHLAAQLVDPSLASELKGSSDRRVEWRCDRGHIWAVSPHGRTTSESGSGCPFCSGRHAIPGESDLATVRPDLAAELQDQRLATKLLPQSNKRVGWVCPLGHEYTAVVARRFIGDGCYYCSGHRTLAGFNDLATTHPHLAVELADVSEGTTVSAGSKKRLLWRCEQGHEWRTRVTSRTLMNSGCPECNSGGFSQVAIGYLYLVATPGRRVFKYGITNYPDKRLAEHAAQGLTEVLELEQFDHGGDAAAVELLIKRWAREQGWAQALSRSDLPYGGASETLLADQVGGSFSLAPFIAEASVYRNR